MKLRYLGSPEAAKRLLELPVGLLDSINKFTEAKLPYREKKVK
jgi:hypothetical protein